MSNYNEEHEILMKFSKEELTNLITRLMGKLSEKDRIEFISKYISSQIALEEIGEADGVAFLDEVELFCNNCLAGDYYIEPNYEEYEHYYDNDYGEEVDSFEGCVWAENFSKYINIAVMYSRNRDYSISYKTLDLLMNCIHEAEFDECILGTENPTDYIKVTWDDVFEGYYASIINYLNDSEEANSTAFEIWINFGERCTEAILKYLDDITLVEKIVRKNIKDIEIWAIQHSLYELLKKFYLKSGEKFDEVTIARSLIKDNVNFYYDVVEGHISQKNWEAAVLVIIEGLQRVETREVISALNEKLVNSYEKLNMNQEAFDVAVKMFHIDNKHELYKRARFFAEKLGNVTGFVDSSFEYLLSLNDYDATRKRIRMLSYEGQAEKLIDMVLKSSGSSRYDYIKFTAQALIYRAVGFEDTKLPNLKDFIQSINEYKIDGIVDMIILAEDNNKKEDYLFSGIEILKLMVEFHFDAATRSRYARGAYYCSIIKDILEYLNRKDAFDIYYNKIIGENSRRPALKDEMKKKIGNIRGF